MSVGDNKLDLFNAAERILEEINLVFQEYDEVLPERQFIVAGGEPPHDCAQVSVAFIRHNIGPPGDQQFPGVMCGKPRSVTFSVEIVRDCAPAMGRKTQGGTKVIPPTPEALTEDARRKSIDMTLLMEAADRVITPPQAVLEGTAEISIGPPRGSVQAVVLEITVGVE